MHRRCVSRHDVESASLTFQTAEMTCVRMPAAATPGECQFVSPEKRAQGTPGACCTRGLVCNSARQVAHTSIQVQSEHPGIPCAMALRLMARSPWRRIPLASIAGELAALEARSGFANLHRLDTSHGCQDHTVLPYATTSVVLRAVPAHGKNRPANAPHTPDAAASTASHPNVRDDRDTSLVERMRRGNYAADLGETRSGLFSSGRLDGANQVDLAEEISVQAQRGS